MVRFMSTYGIGILRICLGIVFFWFGLLKVIGRSPVAELVAQTVYWVPPNFFVPFLVLVLEPHVAFQGGNPLLLTTEGEFVVKNLILIAAGLVVGGTVERSKPT